MSDPIGKPAASAGRARALTLLEVLLAIGISTAVIGGAMAFYHHALVVRDALEDQTRLAETNRRAMEMMTGELRSALIYSFLNMGIEGQSDQIQFVTVSLPGAEAWTLSQREKQPIQPSHDLRIVGYRLGEAEDEQTGEPVAGGLERTVQRMITAQTTEEDTDVESVVLSPYVKFVRFRYWQDGAWLDSWGGGDMPAAVEIVLGLEPLPEGANPEDYAGPSVSRVVFLPGFQGGAPGNQENQP